MASFRMEPFIKASSGVLNVIPVIDSTQSTEIEITLTLPKYLNYEPGTISFDYSPTKDQSGHVIDENENIYHEGEMTWDIIFNDPVVDSVTGETTIRLRTAVTDINKRLPFIDFKAKIGDEVDPSKDIPSSNYPMTTKATIHAVYEEQSQLAATDHSATVKITAIRVEGDGVYKGALTYLNEIGDDFGFRLVYSNSTTRELEDGTLIGDVMPYNGDGRETVFHGGYRFTDIEMIFTGENAEHTYEEYCLIPEINKNELSDGKWTRDMYNNFKLISSTGHEQILKYGYHDEFMIEAGEYIYYSNFAVKNCECILKIQ